MWVYLIRTGDVYHNGRRAFKAHSGNGLALNDPAQIHRKGIGPVPPGVYWLGPRRDSPVTGRNVMDVIPVLGTVTYGRKAFQLHGPNRTPDPSDDSRGCIVADEADRLAVDASGDRLLTVLTGDEEFIGPSALNGPLAPKEIT